MKYYENLKVVYQIQTLLRDWQQQAEDQKAAKSSEQKTDDRKLPVKAVNPGRSAHLNTRLGHPGHRIEVNTLRN